MKLLRRDRFLDGVTLRGRLVYYAATALGYLLSALIMLVLIPALWVWQFYHWLKRKET
jgi:hypothetical protein